MIERNKIQSADELGVLVDLLASVIGASTNPTKIANTFASEHQMIYTNKTISNHIEHLADAFLISKASRYDIKGRKYIGANMKYYFTDLGLRNARFNFRQQQPTHIMENIVYNELLIRSYNADAGTVYMTKRASVSASSWRLTLRQIRGTGDIIFKLHLTSIRKLNKLKSFIHCITFPILLRRLSL